MNQSEFGVASIAQDELKLRLGRIAERDKFAVAYFAARCALRAMPMLAYEGGFECWNRKDRFRNVMAIWAAATTALSGRVGDSMRSIYAVCREATQTAQNGERPVIAAVRAATAAAAYAADNYTYSSNAAYAYIDADDAFNAVGLSDIFRTAAHSDLHFIENAEPPSFSSPLFEGVADLSRYLSHLTRWNIAIQKLSSEADNIWNKFPIGLPTLPHLFDSLMSGDLSQEELVETAEKSIDFFSMRETISGRKRASKKTREAVSSEPQEEDGVSSQTIDIQNTSTTHEPIFEFEPTLEQCPEATSKEDHLNRMDLVNALAKILADPVNDHHQTIGLLGEWGAGKSTWLGFLTDALIKDHAKQPFIFGSFNAWAYEHTENLQAGIAHEVIKALVTPPKGKNRLARWWWGWKLKSHVAVALNGWPTMVSLLIKFLVAIVPFTLVASLLIPALNAMLGGDAASAAAPEASAPAANVIATKPNFLAGIATLGAGFIATLVLIHKTCFEQWKSIWASPEAKELLTYLKLPDYARHLGEIPVMRKTLEKFCAVRLKQVDDHICRLLFVVDDLDRCSHQGIVKVFEAVRLVLDIPNVLVIIAVDQHIALAALALHYKELAEHHKLGNARAIARDYLAKVIHLPIILGPPNKTGVEFYLQKIWEKTAPKVPALTPIDLAITPVNPPQALAHENTLEGDRVNLPPATEDSSTELASATPLASVNTAESSLRSGQAGNNVQPPAPAPADAAQNERQPIKLKGLNFSQKKAFIYWVDYFGLNNPRQLKRLNNTYTLLLNAYPRWDKDSAQVDFKDIEEKIFFPVLIGLITLEYLNALDDPGLRQQLKAQLKTATAQDNSHGLITKTFMQLFAELESKFYELENKFVELGQTAKISLLQTLEPFVLPAIECDTKPKIS